MKQDWRYLILSGLLPVIAVLTAWPVLESGINDDFSYAKIALDLSQTGQLRFNGWSNALVGFQAYWAAAFIKVFGFSFTLIRVCTLPFASGCGILTYGLARRVGLAPAMALFASAAITLSPLFVPLAASFMTDVTALFFLLLCVESAARGAAAGRRGAMTWLLIATLAGVVGGTVRQNVFLTPLFVLPLAAFAHRRDRAVVGTSLVLWLGVLLAMSQTIRWMHAQPYALGEMPWSAVLDIGYDQAPAPAAGLLLTCFLFALPAFAAGCGAVRTLARASTPRLVVSLLVPAVLLLLADPRVGPWLGNVVTPTGFLHPGQDALGERPVLLGSVARVVLTALTAAAVAACVLAALTRRRDESHERWPLALRMLAVVAVVNVLAVIVRLPVYAAFDRYVLPVLPALVIGVLRYAARRGVARPAWSGLVVLIVFALYAVATTHDSLARARARVTAVDSLVASGVPRTHITAGVAIDGWTQLTHAGHINFPGILQPADAYTPVPPRSANGVTYWFWSYTPAITPDHLIVDSPEPGLTTVTTIPYRTWLPPGTGTIYVQRP